MAGETNQISDGWNSGGAFSREYRQPGVQSEYEFHAIGTDVEARRIEPLLRDEAIDSLQRCIEDPTRAFPISLELRPANPYNVMEDPEEDTEPMEQWAAISISGMPASAKRLAERLFELTSASVVRDDLNNNPNRTGVIIRRGNYKGDDVYFRERYDKLPPHLRSHTHLRKGYLVVEVMGASRGEIAMQELSNEQVEELGGIVGKKAAERAAQPSTTFELRPPLVTQENFVYMRSLLGSAAATGVKVAYETEVSRGSRLRQFLTKLVLDRSILRPREPKLEFVGTISRESWDKAARNPHVRAMVASAEKRLIEHPAEFR